MSKQSSQRGKFNIQTPRRSRNLLTAGMGWWLFAASLASPATAATCESLASLALPYTLITAAQLVPEGPYTPPGCSGSTCPAGNLPSFCRVTANVTPAADSSTFIEIWLPKSNWNGRLKSIGNHGFGGNLYYVDMAEALKRGYTTVGTDEGHPTGKGPFDASFAVGHPQKLVDFAWRSTHEMTVKTKDVISAFYGRPVEYSYFEGCSNGGRQALIEAQRYPEDYDGIIAGGAAANWTHAATEQLHMANQMFRDGPSGASHLTEAQMSLVNKAIVQACDLADGVADGLISDPRRCKWDARDLVCKPGQDAAVCINNAQADALNTTYAPVKDPVTGQLLFLGQERGSEFDWIKFRIAAAGAPFGVSNYQHLVYNDLNWKGTALDLHTDLPALDALGGIINATDPDLTAFRKRGGKLIQYHGWGDSQFTPGWTIHYYNQVVKTLGGIGDGQSLAATKDFYRLFMMPGLGHCTGGPGPNTIGGLQQPAPPSVDAVHDVMSALQMWVERGVAPEQFIATKYQSDDPAKGIAMQRPVCAYPAEAVYLGAGPAADAASFVCRPHSMKDEWETLENVR